MCPPGTVEQVRAACAHDSAHDSSHRHVGRRPLLAAHTGAPVHHTVLGSDRYALENLANLDRIPPSGAQLFIGVVPWEDGSGGPCRVVAQM